MSSKDAITVHTENIHGIKFRMLARTGQIHISKFFDLKFFIPLYFYMLSLGGFFDKNYLQSEFKFSKITISETAKFKFQLIFTFHKVHVHHNNEDGVDTLSANTSTWISTTNLPLLPKFNFLPLLYFKSNRSGYLVHFH